MACDLETLSTVDTQDVAQLMQVVDECTRALSDPKLWLWGLVASVACGAVGAWIGTYKKAVARDAMLGAALGPIGWVISLCLAKPTPKPRCPSCRREVDAGDAHCRHCGTRLAAAGSR